MTPSSSSSSSSSMESPATPPPPTAARRPRYHIETKSISYTLPPSTPSELYHTLLSSCDSATTSRTILRDFTCDARPGELLAIVGPSGAGKTTLLSVLAGNSNPSTVSGDILINGRRMDPSNYRRISGYVTQDDALFPLLTVEESLSYSARLRLSSPDTAARVNELLKQLGLSHVASSRVAAVSGGERRRVSIGVDLVHDPAVLLLDEPTSGLDSAAALHIVGMLKSMAAIQDKTIVLTIHQPGFRILELLDRVLLVSGGAVKHQGSVSSLHNRLTAAGHQIPPHVNVLEYAMDTMNTLVAVDGGGGGGGASAAAASAGGRVYYANNQMQEIVILSDRFFKNTMRTTQLSAARMIQCLLAGVVLGTVFMDVSDMQSRLGFFAFSLTFLLSSTTEGLPVFLQERRILMRETSRGAYRVSSYVIANAVVFMPFLFAAAMLFSTPVYWLVRLRKEVDGFLYYGLVVWMVMMMANSFVACFSALVPNFIMGNSMIAGLMGSFFLFSGYFISKESMPRYWIFMHYLSLFKYPFEGLLINEYGRSGICMERGEGGVCVMDGEVFLRRQGLVGYEKWRNLGVMMGFIVGYRVLSFVILWFRCCWMRR